MPCNLAVTIQKAVISSDEIKKLLTNDVLERAVTAFLKPQYKSIQSYRPWGSVSFILNNDYRYSIEVSANEVSVQFPKGEEAASELLASQINTLLARVGDRLLAAQMSQALGQEFGKSVSQQTVNVNNRGQMQQAMKLSFEVK